MKKIVTTAVLLTSLLGVAGPAVAAQAAPLKPAVAGVKLFAAQDRTKIRETIEEDLRLMNLCVARGGCRLPTQSPVSKTPGTKSTIVGTWDRYTVLVTLSNGRQGFFSSTKGQYFYNF